MRSYLLITRSESTNYGLLLHNYDLLSHNGISHNYKILHSELQYNYEIRSQIFLVFFFFDECNEPLYIPFISKDTF